MSREKRKLLCEVCGEPYSCCYSGKPYCNKHYQSMIRYGHPYGKARKSTNVFSIKGNVLTVKTKSGDTIMTDLDDFDQLNKYSWCVSKTGYAVANIGNKVTKMHRYILGVKNTCEVVDHINGNKLDNRKENLRICTQAENSRNKTISNEYGVPGIRLTKHGKFNVRITVNKNEIHIGNYSTLKEAIDARLEAERNYYGEFGKMVNMVEP